LEDGGAGVIVAHPELAAQVLAAMVIDLIRVVFGSRHACDEAGHSLPFFSPIHHWPP
jgi:hypothetical protein